MSSILFNKLCKKRTGVIWKGDHVSVALASKMISKRDEYLQRMTTDQTTLAQILDLRFPNSCHQDSDGLRHHVVLPVTEVKVDPGKQPMVKRKILEEFLHKGRLDGPQHDQVTWISGTTVGKSYYLKPLIWCVIMSRGFLISLLFRKTF